AMHGWSGAPGGPAAAAEQPVPPGSWVIEKRVYMPSSSMNGVADGPPLGTHRPLVSMPEEAAATSVSAQAEPGRAEPESVATSPVAPQRAERAQVPATTVASRPDPAKLGPLAPAVAASRLAQSRSEGGIVLASEAARSGMAT